MKNKAVFFDRDGVVNVRMVKDYVKNINEFKFLPDFLYFFPKIVNAGYDTFLITNQQGVSKGIMSIEQLKAVLNFMQDQLTKYFGFCFKDLFYCIEPAESGSYFRKPNPGMIIEAIVKWDIDIENSWVIGDSPSDAKAGKTAGLNTILIGDYSHNEQPEADYIVKDFFEIEQIVPIL
jgi:D-glycero-D-manno-heptose 1,7-bisphosphate phosphatase